MFEFLIKKLKAHPRIIAGVVFGYYYRMSRKQFGGVTGDLAGYFLQICELALLVGGLIVQGIK